MLRLTEANRQLKLKWFLKCRLFLGVFASGAAPQHCLPSALLCRLPLLYTLSSPQTNSLAQLPFFSEILSTPFSSKLVRTCPFKIQPFENSEAKPLISFIFSQ